MRTKEYRLIYRSRCANRHKSFFINMREVIHPFTRTKVLLDPRKFEKVFGSSLTACKREGNKLLISIENYKYNGLLLIYKFPEYSGSFQQYLELLTENQLYDNLIYMFDYDFLDTYSTAASNESYLIAQIYETFDIIKVNFEDHTIEVIEHPDGETDRLYTGLVFLPSISEYSEYSNPDIFYILTKYYYDAANEIFIEKANFKTKEIEKIYFNDILNNLDDHYGYLERYNLNSKLFKNPRDWRIVEHNRLLRIENKYDEYYIFLSVINDKFRVIFVSNCLPDYIHKYKYYYAVYPLLDGRSIIAINHDETCKPLYTFPIGWYLENKDISSKEVPTFYDGANFLVVYPDYIVYNPFYSDKIKAMNLNDKDITQEYNMLKDEYGMTKSDIFRDSFVLY